MRGGLHCESNIGLLRGGIHVTRLYFDSYIHGVSFNTLIKANPIPPVYTCIIDCFTMRLLCVVTRIRILPQELMWDL